MSEESVNDPVHYSDWLVLLGFETPQNALQIIQQGIPLNFQSDSWIKKIEKANATVNNISNRKNMMPEIKELDSKYSERITTLEKEATFNEYLLGMKSHRFALIELEKLHCFQKMVNLEFIESLMKQVPAPENIGETVKFCLPIRDEKPKIPILTSINQQTNTIVFVTDNPDSRVLGNVQGEEQNSGRNFAGFVYGFGLPLISVVKYKGTYLIKNGYHRAFTLLKRGHKFLPCLLMETDEYQFTGAQAQGFFPIDLLTSNKSPMLSDLLTDASVMIPRRRNKIAITMHAEVQVIPI